MLPRTGGRRVWVVCSALAFLSAASAYIVPMSDTDQLRETCSGMFGGSEAFIEVSFNPTSSGQVSLVIYEWSDVRYLGVDTPDNSVGGIDRPKTYICTSSAVRLGLCNTSQLGGFITSLPEGQHLNSTSIYTTPLKFSSSAFPAAPTAPESEPDIPGDESDLPLSDGEGEADEAGEREGEGDVAQDTPSQPWESNDRRSSPAGKRQWDLIEGISAGLQGSVDSQSGDEQQGAGSDAVYDVPTYSAPVHYAVPKTGYYCVGIVPVTLINERRDTTSLESRQANHAEYSGLVLFRSTFEGELPAVEYPKINFYLALSVIYFAFGCFWAFLCYKHFSELLPMQYYISGTIIFLVIEMLAQFAYYRYINKNGGGAGSIAFLFVIAILNAARNSLSFFLLLIVCMGLSVVTQSLGSVMTRVRVLTGFHFVFGVLYSVGTVQVELDNAALYLVLVLIFPLALTLTAFLMWIIVSLNGNSLTLTGTILHLQQRKQRYKLQMFQRLWRILIMAVIAVAAFFVVSSLSLSSRLDEDYAPRNWRYRWILLDGSLATIYLLVFMAIAWLWRPTRDNVRFAMSQELAQDETEADAEDYEIDTLERGVGGRRLSDDEGDGDGDGYSNVDSDARSLKTIGSHPPRRVEEENVVFAMGDDSDSDSEDEGKGYKDVERRMKADSSGEEGEEMLSKRT